MKLFHNTDIENMDNIKERGLLAGKSKKEGTRIMGICLDDFRPKHIPEYVNLLNCIYLTPGNSSYIGGGFVTNLFESENELFNNMRQIMILSKDLDNKKLYVASQPTSMKLINLLEKNFFGENKRERLTKMLNSDYYKKLCSEYWESFRPFYLYLAKYGGKERVQKSEEVEVLYFDDISPNKIQF